MPGFSCKLRTQISYLGFLLMEQSPPVITIDGPCGVGKGTISQLLAKHLEWHLLDSGALYRLLALAARQHSIALRNEEALRILAEHLDVQFCSATNGSSVVILEGQDVSSIIRTEEIGEMASKLAAYPSVREALLGRQRAFREEPGLVADGRDMGTVVFPDADVKFFLDADVEERARRRYLQLLEDGKNADRSEVRRGLEVRDRQDTTRKIAPLKPADDSVAIDTTGIGIEAVVEKMVMVAEKRAGEGARRVL